MPADRPTPSPKHRAAPPLAPTPVVAAPVAAPVVSIVAAPVVSFVGVVLAAVVAATISAIGAAAAAPPRAPAGAAADGGPTEARFAADLADALRTARTPEAFPSLLALRAARELIPTTRYAAAWDALAAARRADPRVAAFVARERARLLRGRGEGEAARRLEVEWGTVHRWFVAGPFPTDRGAGLAARHPLDGVLAPSPGDPLPPVTALGLADEARRFRPLPARADGHLDLEASLWPRAEVFAYAATYAWVPRATPAALRFGAAGAVEIRLNGAVVHEGADGEEPEPDAATAGVRLRAGWNLVVFKLYRGGKPWGAHLRVTAPDGDPLPGLRLLGPDEPAPTATAAGPGAPVAAARGPYAWWSARADETPQQAWTPSFVADLARVLRAWRRSLPLDRQPDALLTALGDAPPVPALFAFAATETALPRRAALLSRVLRRAPAHEAALLALAELERTRQRHVRALQLLDRLPDAARDGWEARLLRARVHLDGQLHGEARVALQALLAERPDTPALLRTLGNLEIERGARRRALALFERLAETARADPEVLFWLAHLNRDLQAPERALGWHAEFARLRPDLPQSLLEQARLLEAWGRYERARSVYEAALHDFPRHPEVLEAAAAFHHGVGETGEAVALWRRSLELEPHDPDVRAYLAWLTPSEPSFEAPYRRDAAAVAAAARGPDGTFAGADDEDVTVLLDQRVVRVYPNGATSRFHADVLAVRRPPRAEEDRRYRILFDPLRQRVEVLEAAVIDRVGNRREELGRRELRLSEAWYGLYYELHAVELDFDELDPGDVISIAYRVVDLEPGPRAGTFGDVSFVQGPVGRREVDYVVIAPAEMPLEHRLVTPNGPLQATHSETAEDGTRTVRYRIREAPPVPQEEDAPGEAERAAYVHVSTFRAYEAVGHWYEELTRDAGGTSAAVRRAAREAAAGASSAAARIAAVHRAVVERIRYVGLEFGIHGIKPYDAPEVFDRRFGDCKDTATLLTVMLGEVGIDAEVALVRTRPLGRVPAWPASLAVFDHAIVHVPGADLWIDATQRDAPPGVLPPADQGAVALRLTAEGPRFVTVPRSPAEADRATIRRNVSIAVDGAAVVTGRETWSGWRGATLRRALRTPLERPRVLQERFAARRPGTAVEDVAVDGVQSLSPQLAVRYRARVPALADPDRRGLRLATAPLVPPLSPRVSGALAAVREGEARRLPLDIPNRFGDDIVVRVDLPPGWELATAPADRRLDGPYGHFARAIEATDDGYVVRLSYAVTATVVPAPEVAAFAAFCEAVDRALAEAVVVSPPRTSRADDEEGRP